MTRILAFAGRKQSGKDTLAREAHRRLPGARIYHFADALKDICEGVLGIPATLLYGDDAAKSTMTDICDLEGGGPLTVREVLQYVGTEIFRALKPGCWVAACLRRIERESPDHALIADCRFPDEVAAVQAAGGKVVRLTRGMAADAHWSERALDNFSEFDAVIGNAGMCKRAQMDALVGLLTKWGWL